jgi:spore coat polysaccharide biosynthesis protein SpsF
MLKSNENYVFLTVRTTSTRLPRKCFLPFGDFNVLGHVISRAKNLDLIPIVCTSNHPSDDEVEFQSREMGVDYFRGPLNNKLTRWFQCASTFKISTFHTVDVDDPFFDPIQVFESLNLLRKNDLDFVSPTKISSSGSASVGYSISTRYLNSISNIFESIEELEMIDTVLTRDSSLKSRELVSDTLEIANVRLTLDYLEDYYLLLFVLRNCGPYASRDMINDLFTKNPDLFKFNWFRNKEWELNQNFIRLETKNNRN